MMDRVLSTRHPSIGNPAYEHITPGAAASQPLPVDAELGRARLLPDEDSDSFINTKCIGFSIVTAVVVAAVIILIAVLASGGGKKGSDSFDSTGSGGLSPFIGFPPLPALPPLDPNAPTTLPPGVKAPPPPTTLAGYGLALSLAIQFYDVQKTGKLPASNPIPWRGDSFLNDSTSAGESLAGGYFDAGDTLKFTLPMAWSMTMIGWALTKFEGSFAATGTLDHAREQLRWGTDWLLKTWVKGGIVTLVGTPEVDHMYCWGKPEEFPSSLARPAFVVDVASATDVIMEVAAALAAASMVFAKSDPAYSTTLITQAKAMYTAAYSSPTKGLYTKITVEAADTYGSTNYVDEIEWASAWMYMATQDDKYLTNALTVVYAKYEETFVYFSWENKRFGARVLLAMLTGKPYEAHKDALSAIHADVQKSMCLLMPGGPSAVGATTDGIPKKTPGRLLLLDTWGPNQYAASTAFLADVFATSLNASSMNATATSLTPGTGGLTCGTKKFPVTELKAYAKFQIDYILGANPLNMSYMVGYGDKYPQQLHHRAASIPMNVSTVEICGPPAEDNFFWQDQNTSNPNIAVGAVSGGPLPDDTYVDLRATFTSGEPALSTNAPLLAALASLLAM